MKQNDNKYLSKIINGFTYPFKPDIFFTIRGYENLHIYFWICKDLGWIFNSIPVGIIFGTCALLWIGILGINYYIEKDFEEIYFLIPTFLWLFGNYLWMFGNLVYNSDIYRFEASCIMMSGLIMIVLYFSFLNKKKIFETNNLKAQSYTSNGLICRFKNIGSWRRYEFTHMFFWLLKDYCWCSKDKIMWLVGALPTLYISFDLVNVSMRSTDLFVDSMHYISQTIWVSSNIIWAFSELFYLDSNNPPKLYDMSNITGRYISSFVLIFSWTPIIILYCVWLPLIIMKKINTNQPNQSNQPNNIDNIYTAPDIHSNDIELNLKEKNKLYENIFKVTELFNTNIIITQNKSNPYESDSYTLNMNKSTDNTIKSTDNATKSVRFNNCFIKYDEIEKYDSDANSNSYENSSNIEKNYTNTKIEIEFNNGLNNVSNLSNSSDNKEISTDYNKYSIDNDYNFKNKLTNLSNSDDNQKDSLSTCSK